MRKAFFLGLGLLALLLVIIMAGACRSGAQSEVDKLKAQNQTLKDIAGPLPASLDNYFPPKAQGPVYLLEMFALEGPFAGIIADLQQRDAAGAKANYDAFKAQYQKVSRMVPEWKNLFPMSPVDALGQAIASGDPANVGPALEQVNQVCGSCHLLNQTKAHQKYHWPNFETIKVPDPVTNESVGWVEYMRRLGGAFMAIGSDLQQGQLDNARQDFQAFDARFKAMPSEACIYCHATPRTYFVDPTVQAMADNLGKALSTTPPDAKTVGELSGAIGNESCLKCHYVHFPAQNRKATWVKFDSLFK